MLSRTTGRWPALIGFLAAGAGCQDYLFELKRPSEVKETEIIVPELTPTPADILFVVDNSGSMADEQENLAANFNRFIEQTAGTGTYRIAVITTDMRDGTVEQEGLRQDMFSASYPFALEGAGFDNCSAVADMNPSGIASNQHGCFRSLSMDTRVIDTTALAPAEQIQVFQNNVRVGSCGDGAEKGLDAMLQALAQTRPGGCNEGFLRDNANLVVIFVSDENDNGSGPVDGVLDALAAYKPMSAIRAAAIVGYADGDASNCNIDQGAACGTLCDASPGVNAVGCGDFQDCCFSCSYFRVGDCCSALSGRRYLRFLTELETRVSEATGGQIGVHGCRAPSGETAACLVDSICQDNFGDTLARIARELVSQTQFVLDPPAVYPPGVRVRVGGRDLAPGEDFSVTPDGASVTINGANAPKEGESVEVYFVTEVGGSSEG